MAVSQKSPEDLFNSLWVSETTEMCKIQTYRDPSIPNTDVNNRLIHIREFLNKRAKDFNQHLTEKAQFTGFQWCAKVKEGAIEPIESEDLISTTSPSDEECRASDYWVFGFRFGSPKAENKLAIICHLDTVPANEGDNWGPFVPSKEERDYDAPGSTASPQEFLVGRGCIDDKGPAASAFIAARALAMKYQDSTFLHNTQVEMLFDTSEETAMSTPHYLEDPTTKKPDFGIVYDAQWCVRAEKGCERPKFQVPDVDPSGPLFIGSLVTSPNNSANTIPDWAEAVVNGDPDALAEFSAAVDDLYQHHAFDDPKYIPASLTSTSSTEGGQVTAVTLRTEVAGAQHGSAPEQNREEGANPLVSLANFLAGLVATGQLGTNAEGSLVSFVKWMWGTYVFGEPHEALVGFDEVFVEGGNGTTYAVTKVSRDEENVLTLEVDIRYAIPHHEKQWDGFTEGFLEGKNSIFQGVFKTLVNDFNKQNRGMPEVSFLTKTMFAPDIRIPDSNESFQKVEAAYEAVRGFRPPRYAIGGGTDAKGYVFLLGVGPLMAPDLGPPINYHGIGEGAPISDMRMSTNILFHAISNEIEKPGRRSRSAVTTCIEKVKARRMAGQKQCCNC